MKTGSCFFKVGTELWLATSYQDEDGTVTTKSELVDPFYFEE